MWCVPCVIPSTVPWYVNYTRAQVPAARAQREVEVEPRGTMVLVETTQKLVDGIRRIAHVFVYPPVLCVSLFKER
jgi:hypothetical protein